MTRSAPKPPLAYDKPAPGGWSMDRVHQQAPALPFLQPILERHMTAGSRAGFARMGGLLECIEFRFVNGWLYTSPRPLGAPPESKGPPPRLVFKALLALHPALRRRVRRAAEVLEERPWLAHAERYAREIAPGLQKRLDAVQEVEPEDLSDEALRAHLAALVALLGEAMEEHFILSTHYTVAVGRLLAWAEDRPELTPVDAVSVLAGASPATRRPAELLGAVVETLRSAGCEALLQVEPPEAALDALRDGDPAVAAALDAWLDAYGWCAVGIDDVNGVALLERPALVIDSLRQALSHRAAPVEEGAGEAAAACLAARLPEGDRGDFDRLVVEARRAMAPRELSCELLFRGMGLTRRAVLALGRRAAAAGALDRPEDAFACRPEELTTADGLPDRTELDRRLALHAAASESPPPRVLGVPGTPPPLEWLPPASQELERAVFAFISRFDRPEEATEPLAGLGVSPGVVEGRAFVLAAGRDVDGLAAGEILVAPSTTASLNGVLARVGGLVTEYGGLVCHAAIVSRELGFPGVVGCVDAVAAIPHGAWIRVDGDRGRVEVLAAAGEGPAPTTSAASPPAPVVERAVVEPVAPARTGCFVPLAEAGDRDRFGGKAAHLAAALAAELPVPDGVALDVDLAEGVAAGEPAALAALEAALAALPEAPHGLAVRSSAPGEDGACASFAGLHETVLGVSGAAEVAAAVAAVWASAHGPAARAYRARLGIDGRPAMAVLVQPLLPADAAGVRFGRDPSTGADVRVVEAARGLGVAVVDGRVRPDRWTLDPSGAVREIVAGDKVVEIRPVPGGVTEQALPADARTAPSLSDAELAAVHALGEACDRLLGGPQDVEFALIDGAVVLLQSRPVTTGSTS